MTLTDDLHDTAAALRSGWPITNLNRARRVRAEEQRTMSDLQERADKVQEELTRLHGLADGFEWSDETTASDVVEAIEDVANLSHMLAELLPGLAAAILDSSTLITDLCVEVAGLRARMEVRK